MEEKQTPRNARVVPQERPEVVETFADSLGAVAFDGQMLRLEFRVARMDAGASTKDALVFNSYPACRLVLTGRAAVDLMNRMGGLAKELKKLAGEQGKE